MGGGLDLIYQVDGVGGEICGGPDALVEGAFEEHEPDERLAVAGVHLDDEVTLGAPGEPVVEHFPLHVPEVLIARRSGRQSGEDVAGVKLGVGGGGPREPAEIQSGQRILLLIRSLTRP